MGHKKPFARSNHISCVCYSIGIVKFMTREVYIYVSHPTVVVRTSNRGGSGFRFITALYGSYNRYISPSKHFADFSTICVDVVIYVGNGLSFESIVYLKPLHP